MFDGFLFQNGFTDLEQESDAMGSNFLCAFFGESPNFVVSHSVEKLMPRISQSCRFPVV